MICRGWWSEMADRRLCRTLGWVGPTITTTAGELEAGDVIVWAAGRNTYQGRRGWPTATSRPRSDRGQLVIPLDHGQALRLTASDRVELAPTAATVARLGRHRIQERSTT